MDHSQLEPTRPGRAHFTKSSGRPATQSFADIDPTLLLVNPDKQVGNIGTASTISGILNVINTIIGGGALALPFVLKESGVIGGAILIITVALLTLFSQRLIVKTCTHVHGGAISYADLGERAFGLHIGRILAEVPVMLFTWGAQIGYIVIVGSLVTPMLNEIDLKINFETTSAILAGCVMFPLSAMRNIDSLRYTSLVALFFVGCLVIGVVVKTSKRLLQMGLDHEISYFGSGFSGIFVSLPIVNFAFTFHSSLPPVWKELKDSSQNNINFISTVSVAVCAAIYFLLGIFGYLYMFDRTPDNILLAFPSEDVLFIAIKIGYTLVILFSYPLLNFATRNGVDQLIFSSYPPWWRLLIEAVIIVVASYVVAILVPSIDIIFGLIGATVGQLVIFVNPALFYIILYEEPDALAIEGEGSEVPLKENEPDRRVTNWRRFLTLKKLPAIILIFFGILFGVISVVEISLNIGELEDN